MARKIVNEGKNFKIYDDGVIRIDNVRLLHCNFVKPYAKAETDAPKYGFLAMMSKKTHNEAKEAIFDHIDAIAKAKKIKIASDKRYIRDGDDHEKETAAGCWTISASDRNNKVKCRDRQGNLIEDNEEILEVFYGGCYANILFKPWAQDNEHGKRVNAGSIAVQFVKDGERIGGHEVDDDDAWDDMGEDEEL